MLSDPLQIKLAEFLVSHSIYFILGPLNVLMDINGPEWVYKADLFIHFLIMSEEVFLFYLMSVLFVFVYLFVLLWPRNRIFFLTGSSYRLLKTGFPHFLQWFSTKLLQRSQTCEVHIVCIMCSGYTLHQNCTDAFPSPTVSDFPVVEITRTTATVLQCNISLWVTA